MGTHNRRPNIVLFISDQQRADTMPGVREAQVSTPHLEWLTQQATLFRRAYCTSPMCSPARASILSGLYPHTSGMVANHQPRPISDEMHLPADVRVLADYLKPIGYACAYVGKWHLGTGGDRRGFTNFVTRAGIHDVDHPEQNDVLQFAQRVGVPLGGKLQGYDVDKGDYDARRRVGASLLPLAFHGSTRHAVQAAGFIRQMQHERRPFALVYSCHEPHPPFASPRPFDRMVDPAAMPLPQTRRDQGASRLMRHRHDGQLKPAAPLGDDDLRAMWAAYYGAISYVDHLLGIILEALIDTDQLARTLLIFTSDHGEMLGSHGMLFKGSVLYEELMNVLLLIRPPQSLTERHETNRLVSHVDLLPTILHWCGAEVSAALQGKDIRALVEGGNQAVRDGLALEFHSSNWGERPTPMRGWRTETWKYVQTIAGDDELYDLQHDPLETRNLIEDSGAAGAKEAMRRALHTWLKQSDDPWPHVTTPVRQVPLNPNNPWK